jgi:hypothetical protein
MVGGTVLSGDLDIQALQAKLAAQEARLNDLQAKIGGGSGGSAANVTSIRKNAKVTIGGTVNTRYFFHTGKIETITGGVATKTRDFKLGDFKVSDANINFKIDVNDYFDAFVRINLMDGARGVSASSTDGRVGISNAQFAWIRWKNLCNTGFGVVVGRDWFIFGAGNQSGLIGSGYVGANDYLIGKLAGPFADFPVNASSYRTGYDFNRTTQITPYWESQDGKIKAEVSFFQNIETPGGGSLDTGNTLLNERRSFNYGLGTMSARLTVKPIEGLRLVGSVVNRYANNDDFVGAPSTYYNYPVDVTTDTRNSTAVNFGFDYTPACFNRLTVFSQWTHDWNAGWYDDVRADAIDFGFGFKLNEQLKLIAKGEYLNVRGEDGKVYGWAAYPAIQYTLPYGVKFELGYRYERLTLKEDGVKTGKGTMSTVYGHLGFDF